MVLVIRLNLVAQTLWWRLDLNSAAGHFLAIARCSIDRLVKAALLMVLESAQVQVSVLVLVRELGLVLALGAIDLDKCWERGRGLVWHQGWLWVLALAHRSALAMELVLGLESLPE